MVVYAIHPNRTNEKTFVMCRGNDLEKIDAFNTGKKKTDEWNPPAIEWFDDDSRNLDKYKDPDISYIGSPSSLIVSPHAKKLITLTVNDVAKLLPIPFNNETWYLLNVFNIINALNKANCKYKIRKNGEVGRMLDIAFFANKIPHAKLFMVPEKRSTFYFAEHHPDDSENNFKNIIEQNKLFGIEFVKVWEN